MFLKSALLFTLICSTYAVSPDSTYSHHKPYQWSANNSVYHLFQSYLDYDGWLSIKLFHALDAAAPDKFTLRGNATVTNLNSGAFTAVQEPLTRVERDQLKRLADTDQFYRLKSVVTGHDGTQTTFLTSSKAVSVFIFWLEFIISLFICYCDYHVDHKVFYYVIHLSYFSHVLDVHFMIKCIIFTQQQRTFEDRYRRICV